MSVITAARRAFTSQQGFIYVTGSTLWECESCGVRVTYRGRARHIRSCPDRMFHSRIANARTVAELLPARRTPNGSGPSLGAGSGRQ